MSHLYSILAYSERERHMCFDRLSYFSAYVCTEIRKGRGGRVLRSQPVSVHIAIRDVTADRYVTLARILLLLQASIHFRLILPAFGTSMSLGKGRSTLLDLSTIVPSDSGKYLNFPLS